MAHDRLARRPAFAARDARCHRRRRVVAGARISANTAPFSILNSLILKTLPVRDPARLVVIDEGSWTNPIWEQIFGALALLLAGLGLYGVTSYSVSRRRAEIGIRMALGPHPGGVVRLVMRRVGGIIPAGVVAGAALSCWASRFIATLLFGAGPRDPVAFVTAATVLVVVRALAGWLPAKRAAQIDPVRALREH